MARVFAGYEEVKRDQGRMDMEDVLLLTAGLLAEDERVAAAGPRAVQVVRRRRVPGRLPAPAAPARPLARRPRRALRGRRPGQTIYSFAGADAALPPRLPRAATPAPTSVELVRNYRSTPQVVALANRPARAAARRRGGRGSSSSRSGRRARSRRSPRYPDEVAEAAAVAAADRARCSRPGTPPREIAVLFRINAQSEAFEEALAEARHPLRRPRRASGSSSAPRSAQAVTLLRGAARGGRGRRRRRCVADGPGDVLAGMGWTPEAPAGARRGPRPLGVAAGAGRPGRASSPAAARRRRWPTFVADLDRRAAEQHAPAADGVTLATLHAAKGLEWDAVFLSGCRRARCRSPTPRRRRAVEEERRLLYVGITRAREHLRLSWALARNPGGRAHAASRRGSSTGCGRPTTASGRRARGSGRGRRAARTGPADAAASAAGRWRPAAESKRGRCADCPPVVRRGAVRARCAPGGCERARARHGAGLRGVHRRHARGDRRARRRHAWPSCSTINGIGAAKLERYGDDVLELLACAGD